MEKRTLLRCIVNISQTLVLVEIRGPLIIAYVFACFLEHGRQRTRERERRREFSLNLLTPRPFKTLGKLILTDRNEIERT